MTRFLCNIVPNLLVLLVIIMPTGCSRITDDEHLSQTKQNTADQMNQRSKESGWPTDPHDLVDHLNDWHAEELLAYNEPERFPDQITSGETNGWISTHEEELRKLGVSVAWDKTDQKYRIVTDEK